ncbi:MAG: efflux RND transporter periplasmic adaptor subunit [Halofilum sp. (in: g-proteobacteria)]|nr:efflux RND transporter periplasmic adaptor subunit [Halofilum sp. (in: g-proteobacteria)]
MRPVRYCLLVLTLFAGSPMAAVAANEARPITAARLADVAIPLERSAPAEVAALTRTDIAARLAAEVESIPVEAGERVASGDVLARLDCTDFENALEQAEATLEEFEARLRLAGIRLDRTERLRRENAASADQLDEAEAERSALSANLRAQRTRVAMARRDVERCTVSAPFDGLIAVRTGERGAYVQPGTVLMELVATDRLELRARLSDRDAASLKTTGNASFEADGERWPVTLVTVVASADTATRTREARLAFERKPPIPGTAGRLYWIAHPRSIPADLLVRRDGALGVFVVAEGTARFHRLPDAIEGRPAPTDLPADTRLAVEGRYGLRDGDRVRIAE